MDMLAPGGSQKYPFKSSRGFSGAQSISQTGGRRSRGILKILGRVVKGCTRNSVCPDPCYKCSARRKQKHRRVNLNQLVVTSPVADTVIKIEPESGNADLTSLSPSSAAKRKYAEVDIETAEGTTGGLTRKKPKHHISNACKIETQNNSLQAKQDGTHILQQPSASNLTKEEKETLRQKERRKRRKERKQEEKRAQALSKNPRQFLVRFPLLGARRSVSRNFRQSDLSLNEIHAVSLNTVLQTAEAREVYECLQRPLYFDSGCLGKVHGLKARLQHSVISEKLIIIDDIKPDPTHTGPASVHSGHKPQHPVLNIAVAKAIERVLSEATAPHFIESSQNSEDKIKSLFKPVLRSLGLEDILVTNGYAWQESIELKSTSDLGTHEYAPRSDMAIVQLFKKKTPKILVIFEAYSKLGQSLKTPDENRADRVRLLIQGSHISDQQSKPSVVFYLTQDKHMETILVYPDRSDPSKMTFSYYAEKQLFYSEASWVNLLCQVINLVWTRRHIKSS